MINKELWFLAMSKEEQDEQILIDGIIEVEE